MFKNNTSKGSNSAIDLHNYFTTGEFAALCNVKKQTLFHYDDIGVFSPEITTENGYRYYSYTQLEVFSVISILKDMDMPLKEIKKHMDNKTPDSLINLLTIQQLEVEKKIAKLKWHQQYLETKIQITEEGKSAISGRILVEKSPEEYLVATSYTGSTSDKDVAAAVTEHLNFCNSLYIHSAYAIGGMMPSNQNPENKVCSYSHFYTKINDIKMYPNAHKKPAGTYLVYYDTHGYENIYEIYMLLAKYAKKHNCNLGCYYYEDLLLDELSMKGSKNYLIKLSVMLAN